MKKYLVAKVGKTGRLYFVPEGDRYNGLYVDGKNMSPVPIFSFIERKREIHPIMKTSRQKSFWKLDFRDEKWSSKHNTEKASGLSKNPYNKKAHEFYEKLEDVRPATKHNR